MSELPELGPGIVGFALLSDVESKSRICRLAQFDFIGGQSVSEPFRGSHR
jgi:hypothetical protein